MLSIIQAAGWPIWPLLACSVLALALILERFISLRSSAVAPRKLAEEVLSVAGRGTASAETIERLAASSVMGTVLAAGLRAAAPGGATVTQESLRQAMETAGRSARQQLERFLNALGTIATASPLLGLLGTVVGMIEIFGAQAPGTAASNPQQLAHGISVALYNTAFGLIIAIPSLMFHRYFKGRVESYMLAMELAAERLMPVLLRRSASGAGATRP